jgi:ATP-dependent DNA helicase RecQ
MAREHSLPAYLAFHDATLIEMARTRPQSLVALPAVSGVGAKELEAEAREILRVLGQVG